MLYEARAGGKPVKSAAEDRALFDGSRPRTRSAGPQLALVEQWKKFMDK